MFLISIEILVTSDAFSVGLEKPDRVIGFLRRLSPDFMLKDTAAILKADTVPLKSKGCKFCDCMVQNDNAFILQEELMGVIR